MSKKKETKKLIFEAAFLLAEKNGYDKITREQIARVAGVAEGTVTLHLGTMKQTRTAIVRHGVRTKNQTIIAQAIVNKEPYVNRLTLEERQAALVSVG